MKFGARRGAAPPAPETDTGSRTARYSGIIGAMSRCPRCNSRKAKRSCPALGVDICPVCCAEGRLNTIACPQDCTYLGAEFYQQKRRREKAMSRGRGFIESLEKLFPDAEVRDIAFKLCADIYFFVKRNDPIADEDLAGVLDELRRGPTRIFVPGSASHPLLEFLRGRLEDAERYPAAPEAEVSRRLRVISVLADRARAGGPGSRGVHDEVASFFDALDFESDLDYSPEDAKDDDAPPGFGRRSEGGLILPAQ